MLDFFSVLFHTYVWDWNLRVFPLYFVVFVLIGWIYFKLKVSGNVSFLHWLFPKKIYLNKSQLVDLKLFVVGRGLLVLGVFGTIAGTTAVAYATIEALTALTGIPYLGNGKGSETGIIASLLIVVAADFSVYWIHRMHHEIDFLWPFHSVHHSAEVMSPISVYRKHPIYDLISTTLRSLLIGVAQGVILVSVFDGVSIITIGTANVFYFAFNMFGANFRHSHIWIDYGRVIDHVFISPAQHQIHHSMAPQHLNKNHGEVFALWDWMFGTLYVPTGTEILKFGIVDDQGNRVPQPHGTLKNALIEPFISSRKALMARSKVRPSKQASGTENTT